MGTEEEGSEEGGEEEGREEEGREVKREFLLLAVALTAGCNWAPTQAKDTPVEADATLTASDWQRMKDCSAQAEHEYLASGHKRNGDFAEFANHYNPKLQRCFVLISSTEFSKKGTTNTTRVLFDGFEQKLWGEYSSFDYGPPSQCYVFSASGSRITCTSDQGFTELSKEFLEPQPAAKKAGK